MVLAHPPPGVGGLLLLLLLLVVVAGAGVRGADAVTAAEAAPGAVLGHADAGLGEGGAGGQVEVLVVHGQAHHGGEEGQRGDEHQ